MFNKKQKKSRGFTLIELLVVIAIIGLLAGIVLVSLGGARSSARDARIQGAMAQLKSAAELVYNAAPNSYASLCAAGSLNDLHPQYGPSTLKPLEDDMNAQGPAGGTVVCNANASDFCTMKVLNNGNELCVDATGQTLQGGAAAVDCDGVAFNCAP